MTTNTKIRLAILASVVALAAAAPAAFSQDAGTQYQGSHTDPGGTPDAPAATHSGQVMNQNVAASGAARDTGTTYGGIQTDPGGSADAPAASHRQAVMQKNILLRDPPSNAIELRGVPNY